MDQEPPRRTDVDATADEIEVPQRILASPTMTQPTSRRPSKTSLR